MPVIPCKNGEYVTAKCAKIARQDKLAALLTDELLSRLVNDNQSYHWLPTFLTETNREYEICYRHGIAPEKIIVSGVNKTTDSMERILGLSNGKGIFTIESKMHYDILSNISLKINILSILINQIFIFMVTLCLTFV